MDARETDTWQCPRLTIRNIHQQHRITGSRHRTVTRWAHTFKPQLPPLSAPRIGLPMSPISKESVCPQSPGQAGAPSPARPHPCPWGMAACSPSCRCPDGRCLPARTGGCSRARSPRGCRYRRSRASTPGSRTRRSTAPGGRHRPAGAAPAARRARGPGLRMPASWCRAQGRARASSGRVLGAGAEGPTDAHTWPGTAQSLRLRSPGPGPF